MKKTQPLSTMPEPVAPVAPITPMITRPATPAPAPPVAELAENGIPMALCWGLLALSAIVLLVQIWNYFS